MPGPAAASSRRDGARRPAPPCRGPPARPRSGGRCSAPSAWPGRRARRPGSGHSTVSGVPAESRRYGVDASNRWRRNISSARRPGSARACRMSARRSALSRSNSPGSRRGSRTISASSAMPSSACSGSDWKAARAESQLDSLLTSMPSRSVASAKAPASRRRVPVTSSWAVRAATPALRLVLRRRPGVDQQVHVDHGGARHGDRPDSHPVAKLLPMELGKVIRARGAGDRAQRVDGGRHQAASSAGASAGR